eukprot:TRINITY_DN34563_c0_g2_i2.p1 TRINITY_DN34563_c0_g2~~TRINITY_DN34563_c0_g2_i2.p1  ORF type:complete len:114 (-),score=10.05 TRINITY_DN34563_c0_g2_i2:155-496(-)
MLLTHKGDKLLPLHALSPLSSTTDFNSHSPLMPIYPTYSQICYLLTREISFYLSMHSLLSHQPLILTLILPLLCFFRFLGYIDEFRDEGGSKRCIIFFFIYLNFIHIFEFHLQ